MPNHPCRVEKCVKHKIQNTKTECLELIPIHPHSLTEFGNTKSLNEKCKDKTQRQNTKHKDREFRADANPPYQSWEMSSSFHTCKQNR